ncbi:MAG: iron-sulfur cluster biosynthesis protein [Aerococcus sp.]|nr:iron-sulfur cluster biosynthesis protein [Aerococcus sp.]
MKSRRDFSLESWYNIPIIVNGKSEKMQLTIKSEAMPFFTEEMGLGTGDAVRFTSKVYGSTQIHEGMSIAVRPETPKEDLLAETTVDGITFFINREDEWFFEEYNLEVGYNPEEELLTFDFVK